MNRLPLPASLVCASGLTLGIIGDTLLRSHGAGGLNFFLFIALCALAAFLLQRRAGAVLSGEARLLMGAGVVFAATLAWRDAEMLKLAALAAAGAAFALTAFRAGSAWARRAGVGEYALAMASAGVHALFGAIATLFAIDWGELRSQSHSNAVARRTFATARGVALALPLLAVFGGLLITADAVFEQMVTSALRVNLQTFASHIALTGFLTWLATGALTGFLRGTSTPLPAEVNLRGGRIGIGELGVALGLVALLFAVFVAVQFRYLFGGAALVEIVPGLTYAEYARRGFFELLTVVLLSLPLLLAADWLLRRDSARAEPVFRVLAGVQILLLIAIAISALQRMRIYTAVYGLTEQRFYATAMLLLICLVLLWFAATVLRNRRQSFAIGTLASSFLVGATLIFVNPDAVIARTNIERALSRTTTPTLDVVYATSLSADAVPVLIERLPQLEPAAQCGIAKRLLKRWPPRPGLSFRDWNWSVARAKQLIGRHERELTAAAARGC
jgi:hypothetical protein